MKNRQIIITGGSSGIGKSTAKFLAEHGADIIITGSNADKGEEAEKELVKKTQNNNIRFIQCNLASFEAVRNFANEIKNTRDKIDVLINNAGIVKGKKILTEDGLEFTFQVNYLSHFLLTHLLLETIKKSDYGRIVNVSSRVEKNGHIHFDDLMFEREKYNAYRAYGRSKLAQIMFTYEMARRFKNSHITVNALHPGGVYTNLYDFSSIIKFFISLAKPLMLTADKGAKTSVYLASSHEVDGVSGKYFVKKKETKSSSESYDVEKQKKLWSVSEELTGLK